MTKIKFKLFAIVISTCFTYNFVVGQDSIPFKQSFLDSLNIYQKQNDLLGYLDHLTTKNQEFVSEKLYNNIYSLDTFYSLFRDPISDEEFNKVRFTSTSHGFPYKKYLGDYNSALTYYLKAHAALIDKMNCDKYCWYIENEIGSLYARLGDYEKAEYYYRIVERFLKNGKDSSKLARLYTNLAIQKRSQNQYPDAIEYCKKGIELAGINSNSLAPNYLNLADIYTVKGNLEAAQKYLDLLPTIKQKILDERHIEIQEIKGDLLHAQGDYYNAEKEYEKSYSRMLMEYASPYRRESSKLLNKRARNLIACGKLELADKYVSLGFHYLISGFDSLNNSIPNYSQIYPENSFIQLLQTKANINKAKHDSDLLDIGLLHNGLEAIGLALKCNDNLRDLFISDESRLLSISENKLLIGQAIEQLYELDSLESSNNTLSKVRDLFSKSKGLLFHNKKLAQDKVRSMSPEMQDSLSDLKNDLFEFYSYKNRIVSHEELTIINANILEIEEQIKSITNLKTDDSIETTTNSKYLEYSVTPNYVFSINNLSDSTVFTKHCSTKVLRQAVLDYRELVIEQAPIQDVNKLGHILYLYLLSPLGNLPKTIKIIPDDLIGLVSFDGLIKDLSDPQYLIEEHSISYQCHFNQLNNEEEIPQEVELTCLVPNYVSNDSVNAQLAERGSVYNLKHAYEEVEQISRMFVKSEVLESFQTKDQLLEGLSRTGIFHFAGHAFANDTEAYLALSSEESGQRLYHNEIEQMGLNFDMVTLSACETGLGKISSGEGILSLGRSFLIAGAQSVINSLWTVNDASTSKLMKGFYKQLKKSKSKSVALREAKLTFLKSASPEFRHPYYWAGFVAVGDMTPLYKNPILSYFLIVLACVLLGGILIRYRKLKSL